MVFILRLFRTCSLILGLALTFSACTKKPDRPTVWIYTSLYPEVVSSMEPLLAQAFPDFEVKFFQGGSETIAARVNAELSGGKTQADLLLTSDPFWYQELKKGGHLLPYASPAAAQVPAEWKDPDSAYITVRVPVMVLGVNSKSVPQAQAPRRWKDLESPEWKGKLSMGSPLESGTTFTAIAVFEKTMGWNFIEVLRKQDMLSAGGNSAVLSRIETGERPVGILLLENLLKAKQKGSPVEVIYPEDGVLPIPSPIAITSKTAHPELARKVVDWFFSEQAQREMVKSGLYSALPLDLTPPGGRPWSELKKSSIRFDAELISLLFPEREKTKTKFQTLWLGG